MTTAPIYYTAAQIASRLGRQRQAIARALANTPADGCAVMCGAPVQAWSYHALPAKLRAQIEQDAQRLGLRNGIALLEAPVAAQPTPASIALADVAQGSLDKAVKLQRALSCYFARQNDAKLSAGELGAIGLAGYAREFKHPISSRHLRRLVKRALDRARAAGAPSPDRLEFFLEKNTARKTPAVPIIELSVESEFTALRETIRAFTNPAAPSSAEKSYLWLRAFEIHDEKLAEGRAPKKTKRALLPWLARNAPFLAAPDCVSIPNQIRVSFQRKYAAWLAKERDAQALADDRAENSGRFRAPEISTEDRDKLIAHAVFSCGGRIAQAWRELLERNDLSESILGYYLSNPASKSYVPARIAEAVKYEVESMRDLHHGPRQAKLNGPHISRDWSGVHSMDWLQADDFTFPIYYRAPDGNGGWIYMRGQVLLMIDLRSTRIVGFLLLSQRNYTARAIRTLITKVCDEHGLPRHGFYFENGIWRKSKIITGAKDAPPMSWGETEMGLREFGLKFVHAQLPRAKPVERVGGLMQDLMEGLPGYVGRNEMVEKFERVQKLKRDAERGDASAAEQFMDEEQWTAQLQTLCERYNAAPQDGKMTNGKSPDETFRDCQNLSDPLVKFSPACRYLLANHKRPVRVTNKGILIDGHYYYGAEIAHLKGQTLLAWIDPEMPEVITVTGLDRTNAVTVPRAPEVPAMNATPEEMAAAHRQIEGFQSPTKARYRTLKALHAVSFRSVVVSQDTAELGAQIGRQREQIKSEQTDRAARETKTHNAANRAGVLLRQEQKRQPGMASDLQRLSELLDAQPPKEESL